MRRPRGLVLFLLASSVSAQTLPALRVNPSELRFSALASGDATAPQAITVTSSDPSRQIRFNVATEGSVPGTPAMGWLSIRGITQGGSASFTTPARLAISADPTSLNVADYRARIRIISSEAAQGEVSVPVLFDVRSATPELQVRPAYLKFVVRANGRDQQVQGLIARNAGGGGPIPLSLTIQPNADWLTVSLSAQSTAPNSPVLIRVALDASRLSPGIHRTELRFETPQNQTPRILVVPVSVLVIGDDPFLTTNPAGVQFEMRQGNGTSVEREIRVFNLGDRSVNWRADVVQGGEWLALSNATGTSSASQSGTFTAAIYSRTLTPRFYYGLIRLSSPGATNTPLFLPVTLNVVGPEQTASPAPSPSGLVFVVQEGGAPSSETIRVFTSSVSAVRYQLGTSTTDRTGWLSASGGPGVTSTDQTAQVNVTVNPANLRPGIYYGEVSATVSSDDLRTVNVTTVVQPRRATASAGGRNLEGCTPTRMSATHTGLVANFRTPSAWPVPLAVRVVDNCGEPVTNAQVLATFSNGDPALSLRLINANGTYAGTWAPLSFGTQTTVTARVAAPGLQTETTEITGAISQSNAPVLAPGGTVNNFSFQAASPVAPGTVVSLFGNDLAAGTLKAPATPLPRDLNRTLVLIGGVEAPLYFVTPGQVGAQIPLELQTNRSYQVLVAANGQFTVPDTVELAAARPGLLVSENQAIAQRANGTFVSESAPAKPGEILVLYLVGMGPTNPLVASGAETPASPLSHTASLASVRVGGRTANVVFSGLTPFFVGLYQVNFEVPADMPPGNHELTVIQDGASSNAGSLPVRP